MNEWLVMGLVKHGRLSLHHELSLYQLAITLHYSFLVLNPRLPKHTHTFMLSLLILLREAFMLRFLQLILQAFDETYPQCEHLLVEGIHKKHDKPAHLGLLSKYTFQLKYKPTISSKFLLYTVNTNYLLYVLTSAVHNNIKLGSFINVHLSHWYCK